MSDANWDILPSELINLNAVDFGLFDRVNRLLLETFNQLCFKDKGEPSGERPASAIRDQIVSGRVRDAYEDLHSLVKQNYSSDFMFLGLAVTNLYLNYPEAAARYAEQAAKLHELWGTEPIRICSVPIVTFWKT